MKDLEIWCGGKPLRDDVTLVVARGIAPSAAGAEIRDE
jgi:hypothetical protein